MVLLALLVACDGSDVVDVGEDSAGETGDVLDLTVEFVAAPDGGIEIRTPVFEVPPYTEALRCYFGTYTGPTVGVTFMQPLQAELYSHHNQLKAVYDDTYADGELIDCQTSGEMSEYVPLFESVGIEPGPETAGGNWLDLPDGVAMKLVDGQRWVLDMHYINPTDQTLRVNNGVNLDYIEVDEVEGWASSVQFDSGPLDIPASSAYSVTFDCPFDRDATVLSVLGHMHSRGTSYAVDYTDLGGATERIYEVPEWDGDWHPYYPQLQNYAPGEFSVREGETFTTTCSWFNDEDRDLVFPDEMCTTVVVMYPLEEPLACNAGVYQDLGGPR
ncbi:MAG: hypothetical protein ACK4YP_05485 [Myxococcota bacterium]